MSASRRVLESLNRPYSAAVLDAAVERQARRGSGGSRSSPDSRTGFAEPFREAHLESVSSRSAPSTVRASALERLGAHLAADENFGRRLSKDAARALNGVDYLTDRERHLLAGLDKRAWGALVEASDKFKVAIGKRAAAGVPSGPSQLGDYLGDIKFGGHRGAPSDWAGGRTTPSGPGVTLGNGMKVGGQAGAGSGSPLGGGDEAGLGWGGDDLSSWLPGRSRGPGSGGTPGAGSVGGARGFEDPTSPSLNANYGRAERDAGIPPTRPVQGPHEEPEDYKDRMDVYTHFTGRFDAAWGPGGSKTDADRQEAMERAIEEAYLAATGEEKTAAEIEALAIQAEKDAIAAEEKKKEDAAKKPPKPNGGMENPEGGGPTDPRIRSLVYGRAAFEAMPTPDGGPVGPWARNLTPNLEGTGGPGPVGPWSRGRSRGAYLPSGREAMPNFEGTGGSGPVGPSSRGQ